MTLDADDLAARITPLFEENFFRFGELGAAVSIWQGGESVLELQGGFRDARRETPWTSETIVLFWSATKGLGSACLLHVLQEHSIALERRVAEFWPEFAQNGKEKITLAQLLSHQAGLAALDESVDVVDYAAVVRALEKQKPLWPPGTAHGYHARTFGFLLDELARRIAFRTIADYWREVFAEPLDLDIWIGLPAEENARSATVYPARASSATPPDALLPRAGQSRHAPTQDLYLAARPARGQRHEHGGESGARVRLIWRNRQRRFAGEVLRHALQRRRARRTAFLLAAHDRTDDNNPNRRP